MSPSPWRFYSVHMSSLPPVSLTTAAFASVPLPLAAFSAVLAHQWKV